jgi:hypothetical protein
MSTYEFHITAPKEAIVMLNTSPYFAIQQIPVIAFELLNQRKEVIQVDWMTSYKASFDSDKSAIGHIGYLLSHFNRTTLNRVKIEREFKPECANSGIYIETHFDLPDDLPVESFRGYNVSRNLFSGKLAGTNRSYKKPFTDFASKNEGKKLEVCILDTNISHDSKWIYVPNRILMDG